MRIPIAHFDGNYFIEEEGARALQNNRQIVFRYCNADGEITEQANVNGSLDNIAGIMNTEGNVMGLMPHPERAAESIVGSEDGLVIFKSIIETIKK